MWIKIQDMLGGGKKRVKKQVVHGLLTFVNKLNINTHTHININIHIFIFAIRIRRITKTLIEMVTYRGRMGMGRKEYKYKQDF